MTAAAIAIALLVVLTPAALAPIRSYDFFWHLATGKWISDHGTLPTTDPFTIASDRTPWINGEWLYDVVLYAINGMTRAAILRALLVALTFALAFFFAVRDGADDATTALLTTLAFAGAWSRLDMRPSTVAAFLLVLAIASATRGTRAGDIAFVIVTILWMNIHPSALLAPFIALAFRPRLAIAGALALLVTPWGWRGIAAPIALMRFTGGGAFVNTEWLPSSPAIFPLLYICVLAGVI